MFQIFYFLLVRWFFFNDASKLRSMIILENPYLNMAYILPFSNQVIFKLFFFLFFITSLTAQDPDHFFQSLSHHSIQHFKPLHLVQPICSNHWGTCWGRLPKVATGLNRFNQGEPEAIAYIWLSFRYRVDDLFTERIS